MTAIFAVITFIVLFGAWVILPSMVKKRHAKEEPGE
jgi:hypothetical protein